jgi:hypothetical protein
LRRAAKFLCENDRLLTKMIAPAVTAVTLRAHRSPRSIAELLGGLFQEARQVVIERQMIRMPDVNASDRKASICAERLAPIAAGAVGRPETH